MYLVLGVLLQRTKIPRIISLWRTGMDFCSDGLSYSSFFESFLAGDEKIMPARGGYLEAVEVDGICGVGIGILQIQKGRRTDTL